MDVPGVDAYTLTSEILPRLGAAVLVAALVGFEREWRRKPAGLRTHMMVSLGAATFTLVSMELYQAIAHSGNDVASVDPTRLVQGIIGGIGFLGAGSIVRGGGSVEGLTTAGSVWLVGALGVACGAGHFLIAASAVTIALLILLGLGLLEKAFAGNAS